MPYVSIGLWCPLVTLVFSPIHETYSVHAEFLLTKPFALRYIVEGPGTNKSSLCWQIYSPTQRRFEITLDLTVDDRRQRVTWAWSLLGQIDAAQDPLPQLGN